MEKTKLLLALLAFLLAAGAAHAACTIASFNCTQSSCSQLPGTPQNCTGGGACCSPFACAMPSGMGLNATYCLTCIPNGLSCQFQSQCCSGICNHPENSSGSYQCLSCITTSNQYASCSANPQCCGGLCNLGQGTDSFQRCVSCLPENGIACSGTGQGNCCSGLLCDPFSKKCVTLLPAGAPCTSGLQCAGSICDLGFCRYSCRSDGQTCTGDAQCCSGACNVVCISCFSSGLTGCSPGSGSSQCCQDAGAPNVCRPDAAGDYTCQRCIPPSGPVPYSASSSYCSSGDQCCSGKCDSATHSCVSCRSQSATCSSDAECCNGLSCSNGACAACTPQGYPCGPSSPCCAGSYCGSSGTCASQIPSGSACTDSGQCAAPLVCSSPPGVLQKTCSQCIQAGSSSRCTTGTECCSGNCNPETGFCACVQKDGSCSASSQCCSASPYCTGLGTQKTCQSCVPYGEPATAASQCCSGYRDASTARCACAPSGSSCSADSQCCGGLACIGGSCVAPAYPCSLSVGTACTNSLSGGCCSSGLACSLAGASGTCCVPTGSGQFNCNGVNSLCCSGKCEADDEGSPSAWRCVSGWSCGHSCASSAECGSACPFCTKNSTESQNTCRSCLPSGSAISCTGNSDCCTNALCSSSSHTCLACLSLNDTCSYDSDCCSGKCSETGERIPLVQLSGTGAPYSLAPRPSVKKCVAAPAACGAKDGDCTSSRGCCSSPPGLFCDFLNPQPVQGGTQDGYSPKYSCRDCYPAGFDTVCDPAKPCCDSGFTCRVSAIDGLAHCAAISPTGNYVFDGWAKSGSGSFSPSTATVRSGAASMRISGPSVSYIYSTRLMLKASTPYFLEFWSYGSSTDTGVRYAIYDQGNDAYLAADGTWSFGTAAILSSGSTASQFVRTGRAFRTLSSNVSFVQLRLYPAANGNPAYVDDLSVTELSDFTIMAWVQPGANSAGATILQQKDSEYGLPQGFSWHFNSSSLVAMAAYSSWGNNSTIALNASDGDWHHLAFSVDRTGQFAAYRDGELAGWGNFTLGRLNNSGSFLIGSDGASSFFKGRIDEVRIYGRALSASEVREQYLGRYQDACAFDVSATYDGLNITNQTISANYNAELRIRRLLPETVLSMPFDSNSTLLVSDYSQSLSQGRNFGAEWVPSGRTGGAYSFNGSGNNITLPSGDFSFGTGDFSVSAWIYPTSSVAAGCGPQAILILDNTGIWNEYGVLAFTPLYTLGFARGDSFSSLANAWTHVAAVRRGGNISIYENAVLKGSVASGLIQNYSVTSSRAAIGSSLCSTDTFAGKIDEVRVFSKALTQQEITSLYKDDYLIYGGPVKISQD